LSELQERELAVHKRLNGIGASTREPQPDDTPEKLEEERLAAQEFIDTGMSMTRFHCHSIDTSLQWNL